MYGQTEATSRISYLPWKYSNTKISSIGKAIPGGKLFIKNNKNKGEICYRGKNIMIGYAKDYNDLKKKKLLKHYIQVIMGEKIKITSFILMEEKTDL